MLNIKAKNLRLMAIFVLASLLFFCKGASLNMAFGPLAPLGTHSMHSMENASDQEAMDCCGGAAGNTATLDFVVPLAASLLGALIIVLVVFTLVKDFFLENTYSQSLRAKLRSRFLLMGNGIHPEYIAFLFQRGILHPKSY